MNVYKVSLIIKIVGTARSYATLVYALFAVMARIGLFPINAATFAVSVLYVVLWVKVGCGGHRWMFVNVGSMLSATGGVWSVVRMNACVTVLRVCVTRVFMYVICTTSFNSQARGAHGDDDDDDDDLFFFLSFFCVFVF